MQYVDAESNNLYGSIFHFILVNGNELIDGVDGIALFPSENLKKNLSSLLSKEIDTSKLNIEMNSCDFVYMAGNTNLEIRHIYLSKKFVNEFNSNNDSSIIETLIIKYDISKKMINIIDCKHIKNKKIHFDVNPYINDFIPYKFVE